MLAIENLEVVYQDVILVLRGVSIEIKKGEIVALLGSNGAGKTTVIRSITGLLDVQNGDITKGSISVDGEDITNLNPSKIVEKGIAQVLEGRRIFSELTVIENLMVVEREQSGESFLNACLFEGSIRRQEKELQYKAERVLEFLGLKELMYEKAGNLSGGQKNY